MWPCTLGWCLQCVVSGVRFFGYMDRVIACLLAEWRGFGLAIPQLKVGFERDYQSENLCSWSSDSYWACAVEHQWSIWRFPVKRRTLGCMIPILLYVEKSLAGLVAAWKYMGGWVVCKLLEYLEWAVLLCCLSSQLAISSEIALVTMDCLGGSGVAPRS